MRFMSTSQPAKRITLSERYANLQADFEAVAVDHERVSEALSNAVMMLRQEDVGWAAPGEGQDYRGFSLEELQKWARAIRTSLTGTATNAPNPHMRNGLMLRHSFIWDGGMKYNNLPPSTRGKKNVKELIEKTNERLVFGSSARRKREESLYASGFYLLVGDNNTKKLRPVPLHEITDTMRDEFYEDEVIAYRWTRNEAVRDKSKATRTNPLGPLTDRREKKSYWVYVDHFEGKKPRFVNYEGKREPVLATETAFDMHANRPDGAAFGSPDAISALVWARIIRDLIMDGVKMQDALAMFAFKATAKTKKGQTNVALELADPNKKKVAGSAAVSGDDIDLSPLATAGKGYDFQSIGFVVSVMAASLHISGISLSANTALAGSSYGAAKTLDLPGRMAMSTRRDEHIEFDRRLLKWMGAEEAMPYFNNYDDSTDEYRSVQAAYLMWQSGNLSPEGFRAELEEIYGRKLVGGIPKGIIIPNNQQQMELQHQQQLETQAAAAKQAAAANQGKGDGTGGAGHANDMPVKDE